MPCGLAVKAFAGALIGGVGIMLIVPGLILAIFCGTVAAAVSLIAGYGLMSALVAYWVVGNIVLMGFLLPRLLFLRCADCPHAVADIRRRPIARVAIAAGWVTLGLAMVFWQAFNSDAALARGAPAHEIGTLLSLPVGDTDGTRYLVSSQAPPGLQGLTDRFLRIDLWVLGLIAYVVGSVRLIGLAARIMPPPRSQ